MSKDSKEDAQVSTHSVQAVSQSDGGRALLQTLHKADNRMLAELGYKAEFKREFSVRASLHHQSRTRANGNIS